MAEKRFFSASKMLLYKIEQFCETEKCFLFSSGKWTIEEFNKIEQGKSDVKAIFKRTSSLLANIEDKIDAAEDYEISFPETLTIEQIYNDAKIFKKFMSEGKNASKWNLFIPKLVRNCFYLFEKVRINQKICTKNVESLSILIDALNFHISMKKIWNLLGDFVQPPIGATPYKQFIEITRINETAEKLLELHKLLCKYRSYMELLTTSLASTPN
ncbi:MAG: hypothetical protein LBJ03_00565 [Holosporales bacterium]|nr:hypothetical protein [Holosporales bacterium]